MKNSVLAHPEAMLNSICDLLAPIEDQGLRCKIMVMSANCYASLLKEDHDINKKDRSINSADAKDVLKYGYFGTMWGSVIYVDLDRRSYGIDAYGGDCFELQIDNPVIWDKVQEIIRQP